MELFSPSSPGIIRRTGLSREASYADLRDGAGKVAAALGARIRPGSRVALLMEPGPEFVAAFAGIIEAGSCAVVLSPLHTDSESAFYCGDSDAALLLHSESFGDRARRIAASACLPLLAFLESQSASAPAQEGLDPSRAALQLYTSGTTGKPKGVVLTLQNLTHQQTLLKKAWGLAASDTLLHTLPLHHMHGLCIALLSCLGAGASVQFLPQFSGPEAWERMGSSTVFMAVPTIYAKLFQAFDEADSATRIRWRDHARKLRLATSGSAALPVTLARRWEELTGVIPLERFGMSEIGVGLSNPLRGKRIKGSVGYPLPTVETRITEGELWISGPSVFKEYYKRPDATAEAFVHRDGKRFFRTGDTVETGPEGEYRILGRTSVDILKSGGYKLSALEIEEALREHPAVAEAAVIGMPDPVWGDRVTACVVYRAGSEKPGSDQIREFLKERLAPYKVPKEVLSFSELPRNALGKVMKPELKKQVGDQATDPPKS